MKKLTAPEKTFISPQNKHSAHFQGGLFYEYETESIKYFKFAYTYYINKKHSLRFDFMIDFDESYGSGLVYTYKQDRIKIGAFLHLLFVAMRIQPVSELGVDLLNTSAEILSNIENFFVVGFLAEYDLFQNPTEKTIQPSLGARILYASPSDPDYRNLWKL